MAADDYIAAGASGIWNSIFGGTGPKASEYPGGGYPGFFDWASDDPNLPSRGAFNLVQNALKTKALGGGIAPNLAWDPQSGKMVNPGHGSNIGGMLTQLLGDQAGRYFGNQATGQNDWSQRWGSWFADDKDGLQSPLHNAGLRLNANYQQPASQSDIFQTMTRALQLGKQEQPDVTQTLQFLRGVDSTSPYQIRAPGDYAQMTQQMQQGSPSVSGVTGGYLPQIKGFAEGAAGDIGKQGWRGAAEIGSDADRYTADITRRGNDKEQSLLRGIDTEAQNTLSSQLQDTQASLQAAGLGRSGAGQAALLQNQSEILNQANRDKQRVLSQFRDSQLGRETQGILGAQGLAGQGGLQAQDIASRAGLAGMDMYGKGLLGGMELESQEVGQDRGQLAQALMAGLGNEFTGQEAFRGSEREMMNQQLGRMSQERMSNEEMLLNAMMGGGDLNLRQQAGQDAAASQANADIMNLFAQQQDYRGNEMDNLLRLIAGEQGLRQGQTTQSLGVGELPMQLMLNLMGMSGPVTQSPPSFWDQVLGSAGGQLGQAGGQMANDYISKMIFDQ